MTTPNFSDWLAICETKARYCRCLDTKNWNGYADCFTEDFLLDTSDAGGYVIKGRDEAVRMIRGSVEMAKTAHQVHSPEIIFNSDGADVIWAMQDRVVWGTDRVAKMGNAGHTGYGHYHERYVKCSDGKWRIASQRLTRLHVDVHPLSAM
jgi:ketosteroid isomerase-like protein